MPYLGNFLILRGKALLGDAISHSVLPGIVLAFLVVGEIAPQSSLIGAIISASLGVMLIAAIRYTGIVEPGAAIGLTFTTLFAARGYPAGKLGYQPGAFGRRTCVIW